MSENNTKELAAHERRIKEATDALLRSCQEGGMGGMERDVYTIAKADYVRWWNGLRESESRTALERFSRENAATFERVSILLDGAKGRAVRFEMIAAELFALGAGDDGEFDPEKLLSDPAMPDDLKRFMSEIVAACPKHFAKN